MRLFIQASNISGGGGRTLLLPLLGAVRQPCTVFVDSRLSDIPILHPDVTVIAVKPSLAARLKAELDLKRQAAAGDVVLCFGNLPPLFPSKAKVHLYLQNWYLISSASTAGLPAWTRLRIAVERLWLKALLRQADVAVQTKTMALAAEKTLGRTARVIPFAPRLPVATHPSTKRRYDYVYIASGEAHKNHRRLIEAWEILNGRGIRPTLCLTLTPSRDSALWGWVNDRVRAGGLAIHMEDVSGGAAVADLLQRSGALIFPSLFESFGLPLLEAAEAGLPIIASERDYVRDLVVPISTFDPESAVSIARAVMRHRDEPEEPTEICDPSSFLARIEMNH